MRATTRANAPAIDPAAALEQMGLVADPDLTAVIAFSEVRTPPAVMVGRFQERYGRAPTRFKADRGTVWLD